MAPHGGQQGLRGRRQSRHRDLGQPVRRPAQQRRGARARLAGDARRGARARREPVVRRLAHALHRRARRQRRGRRVSTCAAAAATTAGSTSPTGRASTSLASSSARAPAPRSTAAASSTTSASSTSSLFLSWEDVDLDLRAALAGHRCLYVPGAVVHHAQGASSGDWRGALERRNKAILALKGLPLPLLALYLDPAAGARGLRDAARRARACAATCGASRPTRARRPRALRRTRRGAPARRPARAVAAAHARLAAVRASVALALICAARWRYDPDRR